MRHLLLFLAACSTATTSSTERAIDGDPFALERAASRGEDVDPVLREVIAAGYASRDTRAVTRHALVQWARLVRLHLDEPLHTAVPGLTEDPDCAGSVIGDGALVDYAQGVADGEANLATTGLQTLARHMACLGEAQASHLATQMALAFDDVEASLHRNGRADTLPYLAQALAQPMLIVQEVERQHGANAPLARWFTEHAALLSEGAGGFHHPATWHGIWLYDRSMGRLVGFKATLAGETPTENSVDLTALYTTIAFADAGDNACSLAEIVRRGRGKDGYACKGQRCANEESADCRETINSDTIDDGGGGGVSLPGLVTNSVVSCVASQIVRPNQEQMTCVLEASGHGAQPREQLVKELTAVPLAGVKVGKECNFTQVASGDPYRNAIQYERDVFNAKVESYRERMHKLVEDLKDKQAMYDFLEATQGKDSGLTKGAKAARDAAAAAVNSELETVDKAIEQDAKDRDDQIKAIEDAARAGQPVPPSPNTAPNTPAPAPAPTTTPNSNIACDPRSPMGAACGNGCGAMAKQAAAFAACFVDKPGELDPYRGQCGKNCDPEEPKADMPASASCFESLDVAAPNRIQSRECWAARCGTADQTADGCCGPEQKTITGSPSLPDMCAQARCEGDQVPTSAHGRCECTIAYDPQPPRIPFGPGPR